MAYHLVEGVQISGSLIDEARSSCPAILSMPYTEALPVLINSYGIILERFYESCKRYFGDDLAKDLLRIVSEMCHPDVELRGSPKHSRKVPRLSMTRYIGKFASLVRKSTVLGVK